MTIFQDLDAENENLKCCGNCKITYKVCYMGNLESNCFCDDWEYDGLTQEQRKIK